MVAHGGNLRELSELAGLPVESLLDFSANINPLGPPQWLGEVVRAHVADVAHYPDPQCRALVEAFVHRHGIPAEKVVPSNGSSELIAWLPRVLEVRSAVIPVPTYSEYEAACKAAGVQVRRVLLEDVRDFALDFEQLADTLRGDEVVFLGRPNNPTGQLFSAVEFLAFASSFSSCWFVVDEAFIEFTGEEETPKLQGRQNPRPERDTIVHADLNNVVVIRSLTKLYAIPGLRLGFAVAPLPLAEALRAVMPPWSVNVLAQAVGQRAILDAAYVAATRKLVLQERNWLSEQLGMIPGLRVFPGKANYLLARLEGERLQLKASELAFCLLREGIAIRTCADFAGLDDRYFRVAVRTRSENERLVGALGALLGRPGRQPEAR